MQIRDVIEQTLELAPEQRLVFLDRACSSDPSVRRKVDILLARLQRRRALQLNHPNILAVYQMGTHQRAPYR